MQDLVSLLKARAHKHTNVRNVIPDNPQDCSRSAPSKRRRMQDLVSAFVASLPCFVVCGASELSKFRQGPRNHNVFQSVATKSATLSFSHNLRPRIPQKQHYLFWFELSDVAVSRGQYPPCQVSLFTSSRLRLLVPDQRQIMRQDWQLPEELAPQPSFCHGETQNE